MSVMNHLNPFAAHRKYKETLAKAEEIRSRGEAYALPAATMQQAAEYRKMSRNLAILFWVLLPLVLALIARAIWATWIALPS